MSNQKPTSELVIDLMRIRAAAKDIESLLDSALSNASGNPEFDSVSRKVRGFREALLCLPESEPAEPTDTQLIDRLQKIVTKSDTDLGFSLGQFSVKCERLTCGRGLTLRDAIRETLGNYREVMRNSI